MKVRNTVLLGFSSLCLGVAGLTYGLSQKDQTAMEARIVELDCMFDGIETAEGTLGCFQPVIAILDPSVTEDNDDKVSQ